MLGSSVPSTPLSVQLQSLSLEFEDDEQFTVDPEYECDAPKFYDFSAEPAGNCGKVNSIHSTPEKWFGKFSYIYKAPA
jgi:hypothetical protein